MILLEITSPDIGSASFNLAEGEFVIGRSPEADIRIDSPEVSARHARLTLSAAGARIEDLGSVNGVVTGGRLIEGTTSVEPGQSIWVGSVELRLHQPDSPEASVRYVRRSLIAEGGMGSVYEAWQDGMGREVALKEIRGGADGDSLRRFFAEARVTGRLEHPNIVPVHEIGHHSDGTPFYTMKYVRGETLADILRRLRMENEDASASYPLAALLTIFQKVCDAISFAHSRGVIHRDLKPENIMVGDHGEVLVMDWGVAKVLGQTEDSGMGGTDSNAGSTLSGSLIGTPAYMAPEQARGEVDALDARTDVFALGRILFELLFLQPPVSGGSIHEVLDKVRNGECDPPPVVHSAHLPGNRPPESLLAVSRRAMAHEPAGRYGSVQELQQEITAYQGGFATSAQNADLFTQIRLFTGRHKAVVGAVAASLVLLLIMAVVFVTGVVKERNRAVAAEAEERKGRLEIERLWSEVSAGEKEMALKNLELDRKNSDLLRQYDEKAAALAMAEERLARLMAAGDEARAVGEAVPALQEGYDTLEKQLAEAWAELSRAYAREGQLVNALESARRATEATANRQTYLNYGTRLLLAGQYQQAVGQYRAAIDADPSDDPDARTLLALAEKSQAEFDEKGKIQEQTLAEIRAAMEKLGQVRESAAAIGKLAQEGVEHSDPAAALAREKLEEMKREVTREVLEALSSFRGMDGWRDDRIAVRDDGKVIVDLALLPVPTLPDLEGLDVIHLNLHRTGVRSLRGIERLELQWLDLGGNRELTDLGPLRGLPLQHLSLWDNIQLEDYSAVESLTEMRDLRLPPNCCGFDASALRKLERVQHYRFFPGFYNSGDADDFIKLSRLSDIAWERWGRQLERMNLQDMRRDRLTVVTDQDERLGKGFELDLRGTGIVDLEPLAGMPIERLLIDTNSGRGIDTAPLKRIESLKSLYLMGSNVRDLTPAYPLKGLEILVPGRNLRDLNRLSQHPSLQWIGYAHNWDLRRPDMSKPDFFKERAARPETDRQGLLFEENFDDLRKGAGSWLGRDDRDDELAVVWASDLECPPFRGGGYLALHEAGSNGRESHFIAGTECVEALRRGGGGLLEFELMQKHSGDFDVPLRVELTGGKGRLVHTEATLPEMCWTPFAIPLDARGAWELSGARQGLAGDKEIAEVLGSLTEVRITAEFSTRGDELSGLDEIRVWDRSGAERRLRQLDEERAKAAALFPWAADIEVVSDLNRNRWVPIFELRIPYHFHRNGVFLDSFDSRQKVLLVHPTAEKEGPAMVTLPVMDGSSRLRLEAKSRENVGPGVMIKARIGEKQLFEKQIDAAWVDLEIAIPADSGAGDKLVLEIHPLNWQGEDCFLAIKGFE